MLQCKWFLLLSVWFFTEKASCSVELFIIINPLLQVRRQCPCMSVWETPLSGRSHWTPWRFAPSCCEWAENETTNHWTLSVPQNQPIRVQLRYSITERTRTDTLTVIRDMTSLYALINQTYYKIHFLYSLWLSLTDWLCAYVVSLMICCRCILWFWLILILTFPLSLYCWDHFNSDTCVHVLILRRYPECTAPVHT